MAEVDEFSTAAFISSRRVRFIYTYAYYLHRVEMNNFLTNYYFTFGTSVFRTYATIAERINRIQAYINIPSWLILSKPLVQSRNTAKTLEPRLLK